MDYGGFVRSSMDPTFGANGAYGGGAQQNLPRGHGSPQTQQGQQQHQYQQQQHNNNYHNNNNNNNGGGGNRIPGGGNVGGNSYDNFSGSGSGQYDDLDNYGAYDAYGGMGAVAAKSSYAFDADDSLRNLDSLGGVYTSLGASSSTTSAAASASFRMDYGGLNSSELGKRRLLLSSYPPKSRENYFHYLFSFLPLSSSNLLPISLSRQTPTAAPPS